MVVGGAAGGAAGGAGAGADTGTAGAGALTTGAGSGSAKAPGFHPTPDFFFGGGAGAALGSLIASFWAVSCAT